MFEFARNVSHPNYVSQTIKNDIGLLITRQSITLSNTVQPVSLAFDFAGGGVLSRAAGWGRIVVSLFEYLCLILINNYNACIQEITLTNMAESLLLH